VIYETQEQAQQACQEWQKILRLQDWEIVIKIKRARELQSDCQAEVQWKNTKKIAIIHLVDPVDYQNDHFPQDHEVSLVHELLHLHMSMFDQEPDTPEGTAQEQAIHAISTALVELSRKAGG